MKPWRHSILLVLAGAGIAVADTARQSFDAGSAHYEKGEYAKAEEHFKAAGESAAEAKLDPAVAVYNEANALMNLNKPEEAEKLYTEAMKTGDLGIQERAYFNRGNALMAVAVNEGRQGHVAGIEKNLDEALLMYQSAIMLDPNDADAKVNYELTMVQKAGLLTAIADAEALMRQAEKLVDKYDYVGTRDLLNKELPKYQLALALRQDLGKKFSEMAQNANKVLEILKEAPVATNFMPAAKAQSP